MCLAGKTHRSQEPSAPRWAASSSRQGLVPIAPLQRTQAVTCCDLAGALFSSRIHNVTSHN